MVRRWDTGAWYLFLLFDCLVFWQAPFRGARWYRGEGKKGSRGWKRRMDIPCARSLESKTICKVVLLVISIPWQKFSEVSERASWTGECVWELNRWVSSSLGHMLDGNDADDEMRLDSLLTKEQICLPRASWQAVWLEIFVCVSVEWILLLVVIDCLFVCDRVGDVRIG